MGVNDRRLLACPAQTPRDLEMPFCRHFRHLDPAMPRLHPAREFGSGRDNRDLRTSVHPGLGAISGAQLIAHRRQRPLNREGIRRAGPAEDNAHLRTDINSRGVVDSRRPERG